MAGLIFLNKREINSLINEIKEQFGIKELKLDYIFVKNNEDKIYQISKNFARLDTRNLRINSIGIYFCKIVKGGIRLSVEGSQLIGKLATKNIIKLNNEQIKEWVRGNLVDIKTEHNGFVIIRHGNDFFGCGKIKNNILINYFPKTRRLKVINE